MGKYFKRMLHIEENREPKIVAAENEEKKVMRGK